MVRRITGIGAKGRRTPGRARWLSGYATGILSISRVRPRCTAANTRAGALTARVIGVKVSASRISRYSTAKPASRSSPAPCVNSARHRIRCLRHRSGDPTQHVGERGGDAALFRREVGVARRQGQAVRLAEGRRPPRCAPECQGRAPADGSPSAAGNPSRRNRRRRAATGAAALSPPSPPRRNDRRGARRTTPRSAPTPGRAWQIPAGRFRRRRERTPDRLAPRAACRDRLPRGAGRNRDPRSEQIAWG